MKKNILIITRNFPPLVGGMEKLAYNLYLRLQQQYNCDIIGPTGCGKYTEKSTSYYVASPNPIPVFFIVAFIKTLYALLTKKYDFCISCSGVTSPIVLLARIFSGCKSITLIHGLDITIENSIYQFFFVPLIRKSDLIIANSRNTGRLAEQKNFRHESIKIINPGVENNQSINSIAEDFRKAYKIGSKKILLSVGRIIPRKGIKQFIINSLPIILKKIPDTILVIVGDYPKNALNKNYKLLQDINDTIKNHRLDKHVKLTGNISNKMLQSAYSQSDLHVFPIIDLPGDVEGFGMVAIEAAVFGLATVAFSAGGVTDAVSNNISGVLIPPGRYDTMADEIVEFLTGNTHGISKISCQQFAREFSWPKYGASFIEAMNALHSTH